MVLLVGAVLAVLSVTVVAYPFLKSRSIRQLGVPVDAVGAQGAMSAQEMVDRESVYEAIRTLQLEYQLGQVPETVYQQQLQAYRWQAAIALQQEGRAEGKGSGSDGQALTDPGWALEQEILAVRAALRSHNGSPRCCSQCGAAVGEEVADCPWCHTRLAPSGPEAPGVSGL